MTDQNTQTGLPEHGIAIVGRAGRFPASRTVPAFWRMLAEGRHATQTLSDAELLAQGVSRKALADPNYVKAAHILPDMESFDAGFWGFSPKEAQILDPQHRHFLETGWEALEDAGHMPEDFDGRVGVFAGSGMQAYMAFNLLSNPDLVEDIGLFLLRHTGNDKDFLPTRLSYLLNLTGPSVAVQTACSTSLVAVHTAVNSLLNFECDMALAGGVTIELPHRVGYRYEDGEILSPDGLCRAFDDQSQGTVFGSGAAMVVLRRLSDALADGDDIKAVILGSAINNDGAGKASYLAPSVDGQAEAAAEAVALAGVAPGSISYIEAHGTGTPIGDPIELSALTQVYGEAGQGTIGIGSVKTNIGHLDTAAGAASLIKVVEAMRHRTLPESLNFSTPNSRYDWDSGPFKVVDETRGWHSDGPRRAAINSLGVGGTNAHVVIEEAPARPQSPASDGWRLFPFSARSRASLELSQEKWAAFLNTPDLPSMGDIAFTLRAGRRRFDSRMVVAADGADGLAQALEARASGARRYGTAAETPPKLVFLFPGGGAQYPGAGTELMASSPGFAEAIEACFANLPATAPPDLRTMMLERDMDDGEAREKLARSDYAIPALFILEYAYAKLWQSWGVTPDAIFAHSVGEYAGAVLAGCMGLEDALRIVTLRGALMEAAPKGAMTTVPFCAARAEPYLGDSLDIAAINSAATTVVSGQTRDIEALEARLATEGHEARRIHIDVAAHSRQLDGQLEAFQSGFDGVAFQPPAIPMVSSLRGDWGTGDDFTSGAYWTRHLRHTVRFTDAMTTALSDPNTVVIEVGPGQTLGPLVEAAELTDPPRAILPSAPRPRDEDHEMGVMLASAGALWANGWELDFAQLPGGVAGQRVSVPTYAFEHERHWIAPGKGVGSGHSDDSDTPLSLSRMPQPSDWIEALDWTPAPALPAPALAGTRWLVFAGDDPLSEAACENLQTGGAELIRIRPGAEFATAEGGFALNPARAEDYEALLDHLGTGLPNQMLWLWGMSDAAPFDPAYLFGRALQLADAGAGRRLAFAAPQGQAAAATLLGLVRVAPREIPGISTLLAELETDPGCAPQLIAEALEPTPGIDHIRLSPEARAIRSRTTAPHGTPETLPSRIRPSGAYVITGGAGGIGRQMALWLAETAQARVALLSRSAAPDPALHSQMTALGGALMMVPADVTDQASLKAALDQVRAEFGDIHGVIHGAGMIDDRPLSQKSLAEAQGVIAPKLTGGLHLDALLPEGSLDMFAVISSSSVVIGGAGQADYAGANAALEALAEARADGLSIAWGVWRDTGMAAKAFGAGEAVAAPLPGARADGPDGEIRFETRLDPDSDWRLLGHKVGDEPIFPGTGYAELAYAAAQTLWPDQPVALSQLTFAEAMRFGDGLPRRVTLQLVPDEAGYHATITSHAGAEPPVEHVTLQITPAETPILPEALTAPTETPLEGQHQAAQAGLIDFGPRWQVLHSLATGPGTLSGQFALDPEFAADLDHHPLHPALLDMAWTVGLYGLSPAETAGQLYVPMSVGRFTILGALPPKLTARAIRTDDGAGKIASFTVALLDDTGALVALIEAFTLWAVPGGALEHSSEPPALTTQLLATGIRQSEAADIFARVFDHPSRALVVSPVSLDMVRLAMEDIPKRAEAAAAGSGGEISDPVMRDLAAIWSDILGVAGIGPEDEFFALGGHSLNSVRMFGRVKRDMGVDLPISTLFDAPSLSALADRVAETGGLSRTPEGAPAGTPEGTEDATMATPSAPQPAPEARTTARTTAPLEARTLPMTTGQREIAAALIMAPENARGYNLSISLKLDVPLDAFALSGALRDLARRHDLLRATADLHALCLHVGTDADIPLTTEDLSHLSGAERDMARDALIAAQASREIDLAHGPVFSALAIGFEGGASEVALFYHHLFCDGWSTGTVLRDLAAFYTARTTGQPPVLEPVQSIDMLLEAEAQWQGSDAAARHKAYWLDQFKDGVPPMDLPLDKPRPGLRQTEAAQHLLRLPADLETDLRARASAAGVTLSHVVFAAYNLLLTRLMGTRETVIGLPNAGQLLHGLDAVVAHSINFLCPVFKAAPETSADAYLAGLHRQLVTASDHQGYAYADLVRDLAIPRDPARIPIVPVVINIDNLPAENITLAGHRARLMPNPAGHEHFELFFNIWDEAGDVRVGWNYLTALYTADTIALQAENLTRLLRAFCQMPGDTPLSGLLQGRTDQPASGRVADPGAKGVQDIAALFRATAARHGDAPAVRFEETTLSYRELDARSDALAAELAARDIGPGDLVGITAERRLDLVVATLGALKAGAGYVPFDLALPEDRMRFMAEDTGIKVLLGHLGPLEDMGVPILRHDDFPDAGAAPEITNAADAASYVMFTSGTTGTPKAVVQTHASVARLLMETDWVDLGPDTVTLHSSAFAFDTSIIDLFGALLQGGTVVIPKPGALSIADLADAIESHGVNTLWLTSGLFHAVADTRPRAFAKVGQLLVGGDVVSPGHVARTLEACPELTVINGFGPTETHVITSHKITPEDLQSGAAIPIGAAIPGTQIFICDEAGWPVPPGLPGEICAAGRGVANGYWNRPELTAEKFITAPWDPTLRLYRTGDLGMDPGNGVIRFFGRMDAQVKIRGYRVELGEVETVLEGHAGVAQASVAAVVPEGQLEKVLAAYVVADAPGLSVEALRAHLKDRLPDFAQPTAIQLLEDLPLNQNGKVDRRRLPAPVLSTGSDALPETETEHALARIWESILGLSTLGADQSFFELGGHSLLAVRLFDRIRDTFGLDLPISTLFQHQTIRDLARLIDSQTPVVAAAPQMAARTEAPQGTVDEAADWDTSVVIHPGPGIGTARALFIVGGVGGNVNNLHPLARQLGAERPVVGFQTRGVMGHRPHDTIEEMARENIQYLRQHQRTGPYLLAGYSGGALTAHEMVRQLEEAGETVDCLTILDTYAPGFATNFVPNIKVGLWQRLRHELVQLRQDGVSLLWSRAQTKLRSKLARGPLQGLVKTFSLSHYRYEQMRMVWQEAARDYKGGPIRARVLLLKTQPVSQVDHLALAADPSSGWSAVTLSGQFERLNITGDHRSMLTEPHVSELAGHIQAGLERIGALRV